MYHNQLKGIWFNGDPITYGGSGHFSSTDTTTFFCSSNPSDSTGWSMYNTYQPALANSVTGIGSVSFESGENIELETVYIHHPNIPHPAPDIMQKVIPNVKNIQQFYDNNELEWTIDLGQNNTIEFGKSLILNPNTSDNFTYEWSTGEITSTIDIRNLGTYSVTITDLKGCQKSDSITVSDYSLTPNDDDINTYLFPNPATDNFSVQFETKENLEKLSFQLFNPIGQLMQLQETEEAAALLTFDVSNLSTGIYFLNIRREERHLKTLKVIVE
jgi:hypothetical protein